MINTAPAQSKDSAALPIITTNRLTLYYGKKAAFTNICLSITPGGITTLIGPSGCGKSSFLLCLNRLIDLVPQSRVTGEVSYQSQNILQPGTDLAQLRSRIGMVFQRPNPFPLSIRKNLALPLKEHGVRKKTMIDAVIESRLREVGLWEEVKDRLHTPALALSGGQQQRLCIARALLLQPDVLLLDEPCSALDPLSSKVVEELMQTLSKTCTLVVVTHNLAQARRISRFTALFWQQHDAGCLLESGTAYQMFHAPVHPLTAAYMQGERG